MTWDTSALSTSGIVTIAAIPEPATWLLLTLGGAIVSIRRYRRARPIAPAE